MVARELHATHKRDAPSAALMLRPPGATGRLPSHRSARERLAACWPWDRNAHAAAHMLQPWARKGGSEARIACARLAESHAPAEA